LLNGTVSLLLTAGLAACGGGAIPAASKLTVPAAGTTTTVAVTTTPADQAKAQAALLSLSDLPAGWTASPASPSDNSGIGGSGTTAQLASCLGVSPATLDSNPPVADSPTFSDPNGANTVDDQVSVYPTAAAAAADFSLFSSPKTPACMTQLFNGPLKAEFTANLQPGQTLVSVTSAAKPFPQVADHSGDLQVTFVVATAGLNVKVFLDLILVTKGRSETTLTLTQPQVLGVPTLGAQLAAKAAARMSS
jgi:hypothetical protein